MIMKKVFTTNNKVERLLSVLEVLSGHAPVNLYSPMIIVAPRALHLQWKYAMREVRAHMRATGHHERHIEVLDLPEFEARCNSPFEDQYIFVIDDVGPILYAPLKLALQKLNVDDGHRLFMTKASK